MNEGGEWRRKGRMILKGLEEVSTFRLVSCHPLFYGKIIFVSNVRAKESEGGPVDEGEREASDPYPNTCKTQRLRKSSDPDIKTLNQLLTMKFMQCHFFTYDYKRLLTGCRNIILFEITDICDIHSECKLRNDLHDMCKKTIKTTRKSLSVTLQKSDMIL